MSVNYLHGIETIEVERGARAIRQVKSAVILVIGTAPTGPVNALTVCLSDAQAADFGPELSGFSIPQALSGIFDFGAATVMVVNVLDPDTHKTTAVPKAYTFDNSDVLQLDHVALQNLVLTNEAGDVTYVADTDYSLAPLTGKVTRLADGAIPASATVQATETYADPTKVTAADIIGSTNVAGQRSGLALAADSYNLFGYFPKILIAPGFSSLSAVSAELIVKAEALGAVAYIDAPIGATPAQVIAGRGPSGTINFNTSSDRVRLCYPHVLVYDAATDSNRLEPLSIRAAGLRAKVDNDLGYWWSSSNQELLGIVGLERNLTARVDDPNSEVNQLNENGITTVFNSFGTGLRLWGNRTAAWPTVTHMKNFENVRRTKDMVDESIRYSALQFVDMPITQALIDSVVESVNQYLRKLIGDGALLGGECWYDPARNPQTELEAGHLLFSYKLTPPPPMERGTFETEITGEYLATLGGE